MVEYVKISRSGRSLVVSIPPAIRAALKLAWRDQLRLEVDGETLAVTKISSEVEARKLASDRAGK